MFELLEKARNGCADSLESIYTLAEGIARSVIVNSSAKRVGMVDDVVQETLYDLAKSLDRCQAATESEFRGCVSIMASNNVKSLWARMGRKCRTVPGALLTIGENNVDAPDVQDSPLEIIVKKEMADSIRAVLESLEYEGQNGRVIDLYLDGRSGAEIADEIGSTPQAVYGVIKRTKARVREVLSNADGDNS